MGMVPVDDGIPVAGIEFFEPLGSFRHGDITVIHTDQFNGDDHGFPVQMGHHFDNKIPVCDGPDRIPDHMDKKMSFELIFAKGFQVSGLEAIGQPRL